MNKKQIDRLRSIPKEEREPTPEELAYFEAEKRRQMQLFAAKFGVSMPTEPTKKGNEEIKILIMQSTNILPAQKEQVLRLYELGEINDGEILTLI